MSTHFISGQTYNLKELFTNSENGKIVIPDLQRDYCWGNTGTLVKDFVENIKQHFAEPNDVLMMGLLYGYYEEARPYLQLCDGQQRLTTLFLLMGLINRKCVGNPFREILISEFELNEDDGEPNLLYSIRDSSLYFLSDLVCNFFVIEEDNDQIVSEYIRHCDWWFTSYENDPTIQSMLAALDVINSILPIDKEKMKQLGDYIVTNLQFVFFDMENRQNGEETFVIINTTGEPLTVTENVKPLVVTQNSSSEWKENSRKWEEIDNWLWRNRDKDNQDTSDAGMKELLRWVAGIYAAIINETAYYALLTEDEYSFPYHDIEMQSIWEVYETLKRINEETSLTSLCPLLSVPQGGKYDLQDYFVILPALSYFLKFKDNPDIEEATKSVYRFFQNLKRYTEISVRNNNIRLALDSINKLPDSDLCSLLDIKENINKAYILTREEEVKLQILKSYPEIRNELEEEFEKMASHEVLSGRIGCLISWSGGIEEFNFNKFKGYAEKFDAIFRRQTSDVASDITVLTIATAQLSDFPIPVGNSLLFGWSSSDWNTIIYGNRDKTDNIEVLGRFLQKIDAADAEQSEVRIINEWISDEANKENILYPLIKGFSIPNVEFSKYNVCWGKRIRTHSSGLIRVLCSANRNYRDFYLLGDTALPCCDGSSQWNEVSFWKELNNHCLVIDHREYDISMDLLFDTIKDDNWCLRIFERKNGRKKFTSWTAILHELEEGDDGSKISTRMPLSQLLELIEIKKEEIRKLQYKS